MTSPESFLLIERMQGSMLCFLKMWYARYAHLGDNRFSTSFNLDWTNIENSTDAIRICGKIWGQMWSRGPLFFFGGVHFHQEPKLFLVPVWRLWRLCMFHPHLERVTGWLTVWQINTLWFDPLTHTLEESHIDRFEVASASYVLCHCVGSECT